jgi:beta-glucanase (GH16 family)
VAPRDDELEVRASSVKPGFVTTFWDDFKQAPDSLPSADRWIIDLGTSYPGGAPNWGNGELETYTNSTKNVHITHGQNLALTPLKDAQGAWTSGRIETVRSDFAALPGGRLFVEAKINLGGAPAATQQGIWPAFWALGSSFRTTYTDWPGASEWDFMENLNGQSTVYSTLHCGTAPGGVCNEWAGIGNGGVAFNRAGWHVYGFQVDRSMVGAGKAGTWRNETLTWFLDGKIVLTISGATVNDEPNWDKIAHQGHFLLLNVAVGGYWPGYPNAQTVDGRSVQMEADYVGVWNSI